MAVAAPPLTLFLADDHAAYRTCVADLLRPHGFAVLGEAPDVPALQAWLAQAPLPPDVLLMDVQMPGGGPSALAALLAHHPSLPVLVLSMHDEPAIVDAMRAAGACGYVLKDDPIADLVQAIRAVAAGARDVGRSGGISRPPSPSQQ
ncbi:response regulator transcription factor [Rhizobacter sp. OV335]|uniref:response regulator n=1 Tax=Rhizobacter sp. OV335 TaxID=1500264 RepID=UPI0009242E6C|nr:response regulator transcription factor [Rhizobacter sp. OV335]SHN18256.1 Response regulator receiver domain-containing protein [Rhizobacter sp. OV335]